jgi:cytosine/adenosine deaminase-related metal-dependent hydrolase
MGSAGAALVHCPGSNLKLGSGVADVRAWRRAGVRCGLGSDGAACNNRLDTFTEMGLAAGLARIQHRDDPLPARDVVALATCDGAEALGLGAVSARPGRQRRRRGRGRDGHHAPFAARDPYTTLVHASARDRRAVTMVDGRGFANGRHAGLTLSADRRRGA